MNVGSSVGTRVEAIGIREQEQDKKGTESFEEGVARSSKVSRSLSLNSLSANEKVHENSDLESLVGENKFDGNGAVTRKSEEKLNSEDGDNNASKGKEQNKESKQPWVNMCKNNRVARNGMQLSYFPPQIVNGQTMVQLEGKEQWCPEFDFGREFLTEIPLWVNFPKLPLNCWGVGSLSRIASAIGVRLFADECTTKQTRISYARMLVEVNVTKAIPQQIAVMDPNRKTFMQEVVLEWRPQYCDKCQKIGHLCQVEPEAKEEMPKRRRPWKKITQSWQYKGPISQQTEQEKVPEQAKENSLSPQKSKQEVEQEIEKKQDQQTPRNIGEHSNNADNQLEIILANFPVLRAIPIRIGFESLMHSKIASLSIDRVVKERSKDHQIILTVMYGFNTIEQRKSLWQEMNIMSKGISQPWLIVGDFNAILSTKDRLAEVPVTINEIKDFAECVRDIGVNELQWKGNCYTWTNKKCGRDRISSRIDRAFGNDEWMEKWGHVNVEYGNPSISNHSSM
ncbi:uncharacterized protein LOC107016517 [Solanum pennellii]|uniref:Uncharacterized protein LOC107016517 n=1 Tax=Solanum pennellii TaxID=28526 RepID=A0ABM1GKR8_SOLPN|nr:uncharacterized protein LOC107016517 [Solanum pennellii]